MVYKTTDIDGKEEIHLGDGDRALCGCDLVGDSLIYNKDPELLTGSYQLTCKQCMDLVNMVKTYMKCSHDNITIMEYGTAYTTHHRSKGKWYHDSNISSYTGKIWVECEDCGLSREYTKARPKWLQRMLAEFIEC